LYRWKSARWPWMAAIGASAAFIAIWLVSRTAGIPGSDPEPWGFPDALASGLEAVAIIGSMLPLRPRFPRRPAPPIRPVLGGVAALALVGLVSASVSPSVVGEHTHGGGGAHAPGSHDEAGGATGGHDAEHGNEPAAPVVARSARCDLGFNTAKFNDEAVP